MIDSYLRGIDAVTAATRVQKRASIIGTKLLPKEVASAITLTLPASEPPDGVSTLAGMAAGGILWGDHRFLGMILGASLGRNVPGLFKGETRRAALCNMGQTTGGVVGSLALGYNTTLQIVGFLAGWVAAGAALHYSGARGLVESSSATVVST